MRLRIENNGKTGWVDLDRPFDISIPLISGTDTVNCFHAPPMEVNPVIDGDFIGSTVLGGPLNFMNIQFNPHGNGTHTECVGHISKETHTIHSALNRFHFIARLASIEPVLLQNGDRLISKQQLENTLDAGNYSALIIRTLPNDPSKKKRNYTGTNPPYIDPDAMVWLVKNGIDHLLLDLPSVDREQDGGAMSAHKKFWCFSDNMRTNATITELIFVPEKIPDGLYLLNLQIASFQVDVSPSKPVLYEIDFD